MKTLIGFLLAIIFAIGMYFILDQKHKTALHEQKIKLLENQSTLIVQVDSPGIADCSFMDFQSGIAQILTNAKSDLQVDFRNRSGHSLVRFSFFTDRIINADALSVQYTDDHSQLEVDGIAINRQELKDRLLTYAKAAKMIDSIPEIIIGFPQKTTIKEAIPELQRLVSYGINGSIPIQFFTEH